jgi:archaellum component FlaC
MGKGGKKAQDNGETPKRPRSDEEEISPSVKPESKLRKKMQVDEEAFQKLSMMVEGMWKNFDPMKNKIDSVDSKLDGLCTELQKVKESQEEMRESFKTVEQRVENLESDASELRDMRSSGKLIETIRMLEKKDAIAEQAKINNVLMIRNLPKSLCGNKAMTQMVVEGIIRALNFDVQRVQFIAKAFPAKDKRGAVIELKLASDWLKNEMMTNFKKIKDDKSNNGQLLVEKIMQLPIDSPFNGKIFMLSNKLTQHYIDLMNFARTFSPSHFKFIMETPDSRLLTFADGFGFNPIDNEEDVRGLVAWINEERSKNVELASQQPRQSTATGSSVVTRSGGGRGGRTNK